MPRRIKTLHGHSSNKSINRTIDRNIHLYIFLENAFAAFLKRHSQVNIIRKSVILF